jgi:lauroyl/myristoyl acyltransferase
LLGPLHFSGVFWYRFHLFGVRVVPNWLMPALVSTFAFAFFCALRRVRRAVVHNLSWVLEPPPRSLLQQLRGAWRTVLNLAWCLTETYEGLAAGQEVDLEIEGREIWEQLLAQPEGFVIVTAHVGHWEVGSRLGRSDRRVHVVRQAEVDPRAQQFLSSLLRDRAGDAVVFHYAGEDDLGLGTRLLSALRRGEIVALQADRASRGGRSHAAPFLGREIDMPLGPAALARLAGVPLVPIFVFRRGRRKSRVVVRPPIWVDAALGRQEAQRQATEVVAQQVEAAVRSHPHQWFCFRDLWGKRAAT